MQLTPLTLKEASMAHPQLPGRLGSVAMDGELPRRDNLGLIFDELDYQLAIQAYLWALPLVSFAQWSSQYRDVFGATNFDLVRYVSYQDRLGIITANATTPTSSASSISPRPARWSSSCPKARPPVA
jgi:hypothetical protein